MRKNKSTCVSDKLRWLLHFIGFLLTCQTTLYVCPDQLLTREAQPIARTVFARPDILEDARYVMVTGKDRD
jgi:hypothetical protein